MQMPLFIRTAIFLLLAFFVPQKTYANLESHDPMRSVLIAKIAYFEKDYQKTYEYFLKIPLSLWDRDLYWMSAITMYHYGEYADIENAFYAYLNGEMKEMVEGQSQSFLHLQRAKFGMPYDPELSCSDLNMSSWLMTFAMLKTHEQKKFLQSIERNGYLKNPSVRAFVLHMATEFEEDDLKKKLVFSLSEEDDISPEWLDVCAQSLDSDLFCKSLPAHLKRRNIDQKTLLSVCAHIAEREDRKNIKKLAAEKMIQENWLAENHNQAAIILSRLIRNSDKFLSQQLCTTAAFCAERAFAAKNTDELKKQLAVFSENKEYRERHYYKAALHYCQKNWENAAKEIQRLEARYVLTKDERFLKACILGHLSPHASMLEIAQGIKEYQFTKNDILFIQALICKNQGHVSQADALCAQLQHQCASYWLAKKHIFF